MGIKTTNLRSNLLSKPSRIGIVGCTNMSEESIYSLGLSGAVDEVILAGEGKDDLRSRVQDLTEAFPLEHQFRIRAGTYHALGKVDLVIIAVGEICDPAEPICDKLTTNSRLVRIAMEHLRSASFSGIVLVTTNPVDEMTQIAQQASGFPHNRVIGIGGISPWLDARTRHERKRNLPAAVWCSAHGSSSQLMDSCQPECPYFEDILREIGDTRTHKNVPQVAEIGSLASCVMRVCEAIMCNERTVLTVSAKAMGEYGIWGVYVTLPCIISRSGVERIVEFKIPDVQRRLLLDYARELAAANKHLVSGSTTNYAHKGSAATQGNQS